MFTFACVSSFCLSFCLSVCLSFFLSFFLFPLLFIFCPMPSSLPCLPPIFLLISPFFVQQLKFAENKSSKRLKTMKEVLRNCYEHSSYEPTLGHIIASCDTRIPFVQLLHQVSRSTTCGPPWSYSYPAFLCYCEKNGIVTLNTYHSIENCT